MRRLLAGLTLPAALLAQSAHADENLFGYVAGAETLPKGSGELYQWVTSRDDKGQGTYHAINTKTELEYGVTDRFSTSASLKMQSIDTHGLIIDGYLPKAEKYGLRPSGVELGMKYNFLKPALDPIGLATYFSVNYDWLDPHSGQDKDTLSMELKLLAQKYFMEGRLIWVGNLGMESTYADRAEIDNLPAGFDWPTDPEMEIEFKTGTGLSYRFVDNWYIGAETVYETEFETEVGQERWSVFLGPTLHYASKKWWATLTWFKQVKGGGEMYAGQQDHDLHLVEKTEQEVRLKLGYNF
ncbi:MAG: DUF6662 family protein [Alcanivorax sp.]|nr:DUF6662 family protein [Alcanivorax sp.]